MFVATTKYMLCKMYAAASVHIILNRDTIEVRRRFVTLYITQNVHTSPLNLRNNHPLYTYILLHLISFLNLTEDIITTIK